MGFISKLFSPSKPKIEKQGALPPAAIPPTWANPALAFFGAEGNKRNKKALGAGFDDTVLNVGGTGGVGMAAQSNLAKPSLLG